MDITEFASLHVTISRKRKNVKGRKSKSERNMRNILC